MPTRVDGPNRTTDATVAGAIATVRGVDVRIADHAVLRRIDLDVPGGALTVLLGPNGAGKSTLLAVLATLRRPVAGTVVVAGHALPGDARAARAHLGFVAHRPRLYADLTARENIRLAAWLHGVHDPDGATDNALERLALADIAARPVATLSHGMARRVAIARALVHDPELLILDEPYDGLDPAAAAVLDALLAERVAGGAGVIMASHDRERAAREADALVLLNRGEVVWRGGGDGTAEGLAAAWDALAAGSPLPAPSPLEPGRSRPPERLAPTPPGILATATALAAKDLRIERRGLVTLPPMVLFGLVTAAVISRALPTGGADGPALAAGTLWVAALLGATLGFGRSVALEVDDGALSGLLATPIDRGALFLGKWLAAWLLASVMGCVAAVAVALFFGQPLASLPAACAVVALGLAGWTAAGMLLATVASAARSRELLLPVVLYPLMLPLVPPAVRAATAAFGGDVQALPAALSLLLAFDVVYVTVGWLAFPAVADAVAS